MTRYVYSVMFHFQAKYLGTLGITQGCLVCTEAELRKVCGGEGSRHSTGCRGHPCSCEPSWFLEGLSLNA